MPKTKEVQTPPKASLSDKLEANKRRINYILVALLLVALFFIAKKSMLAATVDGKPIWRHQVISQLEKQGGQSVLDDLIVRSLIRSEAAKNNITIEEEEIDSRINELVQSFGGSEETLQEQLTLAGLTMEELRSNYRLELMLQRLVDAVEISDDEALGYFEENRDFFGDEADFESLRDSIKEQIQQERHNQDLQEYIQNLKSSSNIKTYMNY